MEITKEYLEKELGTIEEYYETNNLWKSHSGIVSGYEVSVENHFRGLVTWSVQNDTMFRGGSVETEPETIDKIKEAMAFDRDSWRWLGDVEFEKPIHSLGSVGKIYVKEWYNADDKVGNENVLIYRLVSKPAELWGQPIYEWTSWDILPMWNLIPELASLWTDPIYVEECKEYGPDSELWDWEEIKQMNDTWIGNRWRFAGTKSWNDFKLVVTAPYKSLAWYEKYFPKNVQPFGTYCITWNYGTGEFLEYPESRQDYKVVYDPVGPLGMWAAYSSVKTYKLGVNGYEEVR